MDDDRAPDAEGPTSETDAAKSDRRVTMRDVANAAGVSIGTVSRVINNKSTVQAEIRERVLAAMNELGYVPDAVAQSMRAQATMAVGCMVSDVANPLFASAVGAAEQIFRRHGYTMMLMNSADQAERERDILGLFVRRRIDGLICTLSSETDAALMETLGRLRMPVVLFERVSDAPVDSVATDHYGGARQAFDYLFALGHRRVGMITVTPAACPGRDRLRAYRDAHQAHGLHVDEALVANQGFTADFGYRTAYDMLAADTPPTAIVAGANQMVGVLKAVRALRLEVPRDISLISIGDTDLAELFTPPLTVVRWSTRTVGETAAEILVSRLHKTGRKGPLKLELPAELVLRGSCGPAHRER